MEDKNAFAPPKAAASAPSGRQVKVRHGIAVPGSIIVVQDKRYVVSDDRTIILPADVSDEEVGKIS